MFLARYADRLVFAKLIPIAVVGVYNVAVMLQQIPLELATKLAQTVMFPIYARAAEDRSKLEGTFVRVRKPVLVIGGWMLAGLCGGGPAAVGLLYDPRWIDAGWMLQWLAIGGWFGGVLESTRGTLMIGTGNTRIATIQGLAKVAGMAVLIPLGFALADFKGALIGYVAADALRYAAAMWASARLGVRDFGRDLGFSMLFLGSSALAAVAMRVVRDQGGASWLQCLVVFVVVTLCWLPWGGPMLRTLGATMRSPD